MFCGVNPKFDTELRKKETNVVYTGGMFLFEYLSQPVVTQHALLGQGFGWDEDQTSSHFQPSEIRLKEPSLDQNEFSGMTNYESSKY